MFRTVKPARFCSFRWEIAVIPAHVLTVLSLFTVGRRELCAELSTFSHHRKSNTLRLVTPWFFGRTGRTLRLVADLKQEKREQLSPRYELRTEEKQGTLRLVMGWEQGGIWALCASLWAENREKGQHSAPRYGLRTGRTGIPLRRGLYPGWE